ncbi:hypothetical protein DSO57_1007439 [Entomophthora muscae]|uniref:Uncharacterized protein n=1 Tax=Entomophthora muscae TaxID=34485 RepID=A0ACC2U523_9FUNG|nr:hypothetical protein DSO57_1007439 [Entomophthora muscae]
MVPNSRPWSLVGQSVSCIIKLALILLWALPAGLTPPHPKPPNVSTYAWLPDICNYSVHKVEILDVFQVHSDNPVLQASHSLNKVTCLAYSFCFCGNTHKLLVDTGANHNMVDQMFADSQQLDHVPSRFKAVQVADSRRVEITHETVPFSVRMGNIQVKLSGPIMAGLSHNE